MRVNYFAPPQIQDFAKKALQIFQSGETGLFFFPPRVSRSMAASYVIQEYGDKLKMDQLTLSSYEPDNLDDIHLLANKFSKSKQKVGFFLTNPELLVYQKSFNVIDSLVRLQEEKPYARFILLFDIDISHPDIARYFNATSLFANVQYYPLYKEKEAADFIDYLKDKWQFTFPDRVKEKIIEKCGGHMWLLKYAVRVIRDDPKTDLSEIFQSEQMHFRIEQIVNIFSEAEKTVLRKLIKGENLDDEYLKHSYRYLSKMNIVSNKYITIPLIEDYLRKSLPAINIQVTDKHILLNDIRVDSHFSRQEKRVLKILLDFKNQIVERDQIATAIWPVNTEENYSDWAVDRLIARLRTKIIDLGLPKDIIKTFRNKGYMLIN